MYTLILSFIGNPNWIIYIASYYIILIKVRFAVINRKSQNDKIFNLHIGTAGGTQ